MSIVPAPIDIDDCLVGGNWDQEFQFFDDDPPTIPSSFTGWTLSFKIVLTDRSAHNASVNVVANSVVASLTGAQTSAFALGPGHYVLSKQNNADASDVEFLAAGLFMVKSP